MRVKIKHTIIFTLLACVLGPHLYAQNYTNSTLCGHTVLLDSSKKILPWKNNASNAYDHFLRLRWNFVETKVPMSPGPAPRSLYPQYYFYCAFIDSANVLLPDMWMNDVGEKIPNWFESALSYYAYTGDTKPLSITKGLIDYCLEHGLTPSTYSWPHFPQTGADAGATEFRGFTTAKRFSTDDVQVDHAGDIGATFYRAYLFYGDTKYKEAAINVANVLAKKISPGNATKSPWPYVVNMHTGRVVSDYGTNWFGCIRLLKMLIADNTGDVGAYKTTVATARTWLLKYPIQNGLWVDGHTDNLTQGTGNLSNMSASNAALFIADFTDFDTGWKTTLPGLIKWTEDHFIAKSAPGEPSTMWGANLVSEQVDFMPKMDYQTARYAAQCATWYSVSGDEAYKEKAFRSLNWVTYCNDSVGKAFESPVSKDVHSWWSDCYGEGPRMFYHVFAAIPEWAPAHENHILYSENVLKDIRYSDKKVMYTALQKKGIDYVRLSFKPMVITLDGKKISPGSKAGSESYTLRELGNGDYALQVNRLKAGKVVIMIE
ncbi:hypothetical protein FC093_20935 [Ilyomonas limi]|uniref:Alpha-L-rhamnosidase six-hairpin glycosidase domain-containing protein n=1 Tax=Ilyomonas limi TaxID=2575867 RepID=A0A4V5UTI8_9BACT|nr:hypothetical protein [Ilyomonas limi]TKK65133.1 hypothetical protein FC093_20935 [Ilyomonas limi]